MAAPSLVQATAGAVLTSTAGGHNFAAAASAVGNLLMWVVMQDGTGTTLTVDSASALTEGVEDLAGTDDQATVIGPVDVGNPAAGKLVAFLCRSIDTSTMPRLQFTISSGDDCYAQAFEFTGAHAGTTLADVIENDATTHASAAGTSTTISDVGVVTNGADRLAIQVVGVNDDNVIDAFTGMSGGTWAELAAEFRTATGTDGCIGAQAATIASAGTIDGGSYTMAASDGWGVLGFAIKPPATGPAASLVYDPQPLRHLRAR